MKTGVDQFLFYSSIFSPSYYTKSPNQTIEPFSNAGKCLPSQISGLHTQELVSQILDAALLSLGQDTLQNTGWGFLVR